MKYSKLILSALMLAVFVAPAMAQEPKKPDAERERPVHHHPADANKDGVLSRAEFDANNDARFKEMDKDGDGNVTAEEMRAHHEARRTEMKERMKSGNPHAKERMEGRHGKDHKKQAPVKE